MCGEHPVAPLRQPSAAHAHDLSWSHLVHAGIDRGFGILCEHEDFAEPVLVHARFYARMRKDRFRLGAEQHAVGSGIVEQRLHAHAVAHQEQLFAANVPDREGEHAVQPFDDPVAPLQVSAQHDFGVALALEPVTEPTELVAQLHEVVDLAGVNERGDRPPRVVLDLHRLHAAGEVDDRQPPMSQSDMLIDPDATGIGSAKHHRFCHFRDDVPVCIEIVIEANPTSYSAHHVTLSSSCLDRPPSIVFCSAVHGVIRCENSSPGRTQNQSAASQSSLLGAGRGAVATRERCPI
jgi:hypothetical protein